MLKLSLPIAVAIVLAPSVAWAEPAAKVQDDDQGYTYEFRDDILDAGANAARGATIHVRPGPVRRTLIRPRLHFVPEMLKSVEKV